MTPESMKVSKPTLPNQQSHHGHAFPLLVQCNNPDATLDDTIHWISHQRSNLEEQLQTHGAMLFRGFAVQSPEDFDQFVRAFEWKNFPYDQSLSNAVRINFTPRVFSANEAPSDVAIHLHHEMAQTPLYPSKLFFFCLQPAEDGGATPLCRSDVLYERMQERCPEFAEQCEEKGLRYTNVMPSENDASSGMGRSWQGTLQAVDREQAEKRLQELGYSWEWLADGCLRATTPVLPAVREVSGGRKTFFNQLIAASQGWKDTRNDPAKAITFGDGSPLDWEAVLLVAKMAEELIFDLPWQQGDVALVDNFLVMHGRRTFRGTRRVLASLVAV